MSYDPRLGPRIFVKRDYESSIGRGAVLYAAHFQDGLAALVRAAVSAASAGVEDVWITEGWRPARRAGVRDLHEQLRALDFTYRLVGGVRPTRDEYEEAVRRMRLTLGPDYDIQAHGENDGLHIHGEIDPKF